MRESGVALKMTTAVAVIGLIAAVITAHFTGIASATSLANIYTDKKVDEVKSDMNDRLDRLETKQDRMLEILTK